MPRPPPTGFGWTDTHASGSPATQCLLYAFLCSVADARGQSRYGDPPELHDRTTTSLAAKVLFQVVNRLNLLSIVRVLERGRLFELYGVLS
jgi:hypothetical protein